MIEQSAMLEQSAIGNTQLSQEMKSKVQPANYITYSPQPGRPQKACTATVQHIVDHAIAQLAVQHALLMTTHVAATSLRQGN